MEVTSVYTRQWTYRIARDAVLCGELVMIAKAFDMSNKHDSRQG